MAIFLGIQEYIALNVNNIARVQVLLASRAIYSCIPLKAIQYYIIIKYDISSCRHTVMTIFHAFYMISFKMQLSSMI